MDRLSQEDIGRAELEWHYFKMSIDPNPERKVRRPERMMSNN